jgi:hypothetical protein
MAAPTVNEAKMTYWIQVQGEQQKRIADSLEAILVQLREMNERAATRP